MRLRKKSKTCVLILTFLGAMFSASAQKNFKYAAPIQKIDSTGFYKIGLSPTFVAKSTATLSDVRLTDSKGNYVPYINAENLPKTDHEQFVVFPEVQAKLKTDTGTTFIVESKEKLPVNRLWLKLKNTAVERTVNLSGSDDLGKWFAIDENVPLQKAVLNSDGTYLQSLSFPASNYRYLKLLVNDKNKAPIKFLEAGIYTEQSVADVYFPIPGAKITRADSNKASYITIALNDNYLVNQISLEIAAPKYYKRNISVYQADKQLVTSAELNSNKPAIIFLSAKTNKLELQIENGDNLPLIIGDIKIAQADQFVVSYLQAGQTYQLLTGDAKVTTPDYDLKFFTDSIHDRIPGIVHGLVVNNTAFYTPLVVAKHDYSALLWIAIGAALLLLLLLTFKMLKEVNGKAAR